MTNDEPRMDRIERQQELNTQKCKRCLAPADGLDGFHCQLCWELFCAEGWWKEWELEEAIYQLHEAESDFEESNLMSDQAAADRLRHWQEVVEHLWAESGE